MSFISPLRRFELALSEAFNAPDPSPVSPTEPSRALIPDGSPLIAICHLPWDWVWQRPQQFLSRLARSHPVLFVETHCTDTPESFTRTRVAPNHPDVTILALHLPATRWHDSDFIDAKRRAQIGRAVQQECRDRSRMPSSA
eukprot:TRINITY_DN41705_c0_g1_i1.p1 TRINITY_DN41705_c0_g1~~TRINITY_DN41705_c0_g1_i1.p1  ORF type:complete len:141 (+),score=8.93 TRINITY_DN41705_c0_g1_i1:199-621(+)